MAERATSHETVRAGRPLTVGTVTLLPIERVVLHADLCGSHGWLTAAKEPYALVLCEPGGIRAVDASAQELPLAVLRDRIPELDALLSSL
ncbi:MAG: hypothetical protein JSW68_03745 [Burkholderiales bacterium]|nr:MAG: hypothetical protein JSW68_03745 [Burkholderiales bacterium]